MATTYDEVVPDSPTPPADELRTRLRPAERFLRTTDQHWGADRLQAATLMVHNTALALAVSGAAIASAVRGPGRWLRVAGIVDVILVGATIAKYAFGWDLRVDELFGLAHLMNPAGQPGQMTVNTAICVVLIGAAFLTGAPTPVLAQHSAHRHSPPGCHRM